MSNVPVKLLYTPPLDENRLRKIELETQLGITRDDMVAEARSNITPASRLTFARKVLVYIYKKYGDKGKELYSLK